MRCPSADHFGYQTDGENVIRVDPRDVEPAIDQLTASGRQVLVADPTDSTDARLP